MIKTAMIVINVIFKAEHRLQNRKKEVDLRIEDCA